jgi:hypothetical protein
MLSSGLMLLAAAALFGQAVWICARARVSLQPVCVQANRPRRY